jgi:hypothetical protein
MGPNVPLPLSAPSERKSKWRERDMRLRAALAAAAGGALVLAAGLAGTANAEADCSHDLRVLAQPRDGLTLLEKYKDEFKGLSGRVLQH